jgi:hypothetical protein
MMAGAPSELGWAEVCWSGLVWSGRCWLLVLGREVCGWGGGGGGEGGGCQSAAAYIAGAQPPLPLTLLGPLPLGVACLEDPLCQQTDAGHAMPPTVPSSCTRCPCCPPQGSPVATVRPQLQYWRWGCASGCRAAKPGSSSKSKIKKKKAKHKVGAGVGGLEEQPAGAASQGAAAAPEAGPAGAGGAGPRSAGAAALPPRPPLSSSAAAAGARSGAGVAAAASGQEPAASPASTLPAGSLPGSSFTTTVTSGRSSLDSSPERLSMHSAHSMAGSAPGSPRPGSSQPATAAGANGGAQPLIHGAALPRPPYWDPRLGMLAAWEEEDDIMDDYECDPLAAAAVPVGGAVPFWGGGNSLAADDYVGA